jgi:hypothetical protein
MAAVRQVVEERYRHLACLAYLTLDDGRTDDRQLAAQVHRAIWAAVPRHLPQSSPDESRPGEINTGEINTDESNAEEIYTELRARLLTRLLREEPRGGRAARWLRRLARPPLPRWLSLRAPALPWRGTPLGDSMSRRNKSSRAMLALAAVDGLTPAQAREALAAAGLDPGHQTAAAQVPGTDEARSALASFDAATLRAVPGPMTRSRRRRFVVTAVVTAVVVAAAVIVGTTALNDAHHAGDPVVVSAEVWRQALHNGGESAGSWPTTGNLAGDWPLLRAAANADRIGEQLNPDDTVQILYAGDLAGFGPLVVMTDSSQDGIIAPSIPVDAYYPGAPIPLVRLGLYNDADQTAPNLIPLPGDRFLVPPWRTGLRMAWLAGRSAPVWHPVAVHDGIATGIPQLQARPLSCWPNVAAISYSDNSFGPANKFTGTVLAQPPDGSLLIWPVEVQYNSGPDNIPALPLEEIGDLTCGEQAGSASGWLEQGTFQLGVTDMAQTSLPDNGGPVAAITIQAQDASLRPPVLAQPPFDGSEVLFLDLATGQTLTTASSNGEPPPPLAAAWWKSPSAHWYLLAAGQGLRSITATALSPRTEPGPFAIFPATNSTTPQHLGPLLLTSGGSTAALALPPGK